MRARTRLWRSVTYGLIRLGLVGWALMGMDGALRVVALAVMLAVVTSAAHSASGAVERELGAMVTTCAAAPDVSWCKSAAESFRDDWPEALQGDYQAQRNVSFCLATGCDGAVIQNRAHGCAWRVVILASGSAKVDSTDVGFFDAYCRGRLSQAEVVQMKGQAAALFQRVYQRPLPNVF